ncbi:MAG: DinB family protein [Rudaea sp.]
MTDHSPVLPEIASYLERISNRRDLIWKELEGLDAEALNWKPLKANTNSLIVLGTHSIGSEHGWISEVIGGQPRTRIRSREFEAMADNLDRLRVEFEATGRNTERTLSGLTESDLNDVREREGFGRVTVRWIIMHVIEHLSEHLGQMQLTRQLWENRQPGSVE